MLHVGQQVVLVDDYWEKAVPRAGITRPVRNTVYTIRGFGHPCPDGTPRIWLCELCNPVQRWSDGGVVYDAEIAFRAQRFRPVRKTDISVFTAMLTKLPENV